MAANVTSFTDINDFYEEIILRIKHAKDAYEKAVSARDNLESYDPNSSGFEQFESAANAFMDAANATNAALEAAGKSPIFDSPAFKNTSSGLDLYNDLKDHGEASQAFGKDASGYYLEPSVENWNQAATSFFNLLGTAGGVALTAGIILSNPAMMVLGGLFGAMGFFGGDGFKDLMDGLSKLFDEGKSIASPIILDLDGNGVETTSIDSGVPFDYSGDGLAEHTGWVGGNDGLLALDRNGSGTIDNGGELFGNYTELTSGDRASNGFEALAELDSNFDGLISSDDRDFSKLKVWRDLNQNGQSDEGELLGLEEAGVQSISTLYSESELVDDNGNEHRQIGSFTNLDGEQLGATDVWFIRDPRVTIPSERVPVSMEISKLPEIMGSGMVHGLHQTMARENGERLFSLLTDYVSESDSSVRNSLIDEIIFEWTGVTQYEPSSRGSNIDDARKLYSLEALLGDKFLQGGTSENPRPDAGAHLSGLYMKLADYVEGSLLSQSHFKDVVAKIDLNIGDDAAIEIDVSVLMDDLHTEYVNNPSSWSGYVREFVLVLNVVDISGQKITAAIQDKASEYEGEFSRHLTHLDLNPVFGTDDADELLGSEESDYIAGLEGNDTLYGKSGDDTLDGGEGNDTLEGGKGSDTYKFGVNSGNDLIDEGYDTSANTDRVLLDAGITTADVSVERIGTGNDLRLTIADSDSELRIDDYFYKDGYSPYALEEIHFADGTVWDREQVKAMVMQPTDGDDLIIGYASDDVLDGGAGNDTLKGGEGSDTYKFGRSSGNDLIDEGYDSGTNTDRVLLDAGITTADVSVERIGTGNDLRLTIADSDSELRIDDYFYQDGYSPYALEEIHFADGTVWDREQVKAMVMQPTDGDDLIIGYASDDVLDGGAGNDTLKGGEGSDTYKFGRSSGNDLIDEGYDSGTNTDRVLLDAGITTADVSVERIGTGNDLRLTIADSDSELRIDDYFYKDGYSPYALEEIHFADGTVWDREQVKAMVMQPTDGDDLIIGYASDDVLDGGAGNDTLKGGEGSDTYKFGRSSGNDLIDEGYDSGTNTDRVLLDAGITTADVSVERIGTGNDLRLTIADSDSELRIDDYFYQDGYSPYALEEIHFADGTVWDREQVKAMVMQPTDGDDLIIGYASDDVLDGGAGNDTLKGGEGSDTYKFGRSSGNDLIDEGYDSGTNTDRVLLDAGITTADISVERIGTGNDLRLTIADSDSELRIDDYFYQDGYSPYALEEIHFADGTVWDREQVKAMVMQPTDGDDLIIGYASDDVLDGGAGNDTLKGGEGSDTYKFGRSSGNDLIDEGYDSGTNTDRVLLDAGITTADISVERIGTGNDLRLTIADSDSELRIDNYFYQDGNSPYALEEIHFADGSVWDFTTVKGIIDEGVTAASEVSLMLNSETPLEQPGPAGSDDFVETHSELVGNDLIDTLLF